MDLSPVAATWAVLPSREGGRWLRRGIPAPTLWLLALALVLGSILPVRRFAVVSMGTTIVAGTPADRVARQEWSTTLPHPVALGSAHHLPVGLPAAISRAFGPRTGAAYRARLLGGPGSTSAVLANPAQGLAAQVDRHGVRVQVLGSRAAWARLDLQAVRSNGVPLALATPRITTRGARVQITYGDVTAWYTNTPMGLEQGWTVRAPARGSQGSSALVVRLGVRGNLPARLEGGTLWLGSGRGALRYGNLLARDARGHILPARLTLAGRELAVQVGVRGATFPVTIDPTLTVSGSVGLGYGVSLSGDGSTALVGDYGYNGGLGAAFIFSRGNGDWSAAPVVLSAPSTFLMGFAVALSTDGQTALVSSVSTSAVYIYSKSATGWVSTGTPTAQLTVAGDTPDTNLFGSSVSLAADGSVALIGDSFAATAPLFLRPAGGWATTATPTATLSVPNAQEFGVSVALSADGNTALVGDDVLDQAYIYSKPNTGWSSSSVPTVVLSNGSQQHFGFAVALSASGSTALVSDDLSNVVDVFTASGSGWGTVTAPVAVLSVPNPSDFGFSVALSASGSEAAIGDISANKGYVFWAGSGGWSSQTVPGLTLTAPGSKSLGCSVALSTDGTTAVVGDAAGSEAFDLVIPQPSAASPTVTPSPVQSVTPVDTSTPTITNTVTATVTITPTDTATGTFTTTPTSTATLTSTVTLTSTATRISSATSTSTATATLTDTNTVPPTATPLPGRLPSVWRYADIGPVPARGSATYDGFSYTLNLTGENPAGFADSANVVYQPWTGDGAITARIASQTNTASNATAGIMFRGSLAANAVSIAALLTPSLGAKILTRRATGAPTHTAGRSGFHTPYWFRLQRHGNQFFVSASADGRSWLVIYVTTMSMAPTVLVGLVGGEGATVADATAVFDSVSVLPPDSIVTPLPSPTATGISLGTPTLTPTITATGTPASTTTVTPITIASATAGTTDTVTPISTHTATPIAIASATATGTATTPLLTTIIHLDAPDNSSPFGTVMTLTAKAMTYPGGDPVRGGTLSFFIDGSSIGANMPLEANSSGATVTGPELRVGAHTIRVTYSGGGMYKRSRYTQSMTIVRATPDGVLTFTPNPASHRAVVVFTFTLTSPASVAPTGMVTFKSGTRIIQRSVPLANGVARLVYGPFHIGSDGIEAFYSGDSNFTPFSSKVLDLRVH